MAGLCSVKSAASCCSLEGGGESIMLRLFVWDVYLKILRDCVNKRRQPEICLFDYQDKTINID